MTVLNAPSGQNLPKYLNSGAFNASSKMSEDIVWSDQLTSPTGVKNLFQQGSFRRTNLNQSQENWRARYQFDNQQAQNKKIATRQAGKRKNFFNTPSEMVYEISRASGVVPNFDEKVFKQNGKADSMSNTTGWARTRTGITQTGSQRSSHAVTKSVEMASMKLGVSTGENSKQQTPYQTKRPDPINTQKVSQPKTVIGLTIEKQEKGLKATGNLDM